MEAAALSIGTSCEEKVVRAFPVQATHIKLQEGKHAFFKPPSRLFSKCNTNVMFPLKMCFECAEAMATPLPRLRAGHGQVNLLAVLNVSNVE